MMSSLQRAIGILLLASLPASASMFDAGKHCVGYKFKMKSLFNSDVVAKNCDVSAQLLPMVGGGYQIEVSVPVSTFESRDKNWDQDLRDSLKDSDQPDVIFHSKVMSEKEWKQLVQKSKVDLDGEISFANKTFPITASCTLIKVTNGVEVDGVTKVSFSKFGLEPPKKGGGFIAKADSDLEIHFHLVSDKILGADKLFAPPEKDKDIIKDAMKKIDESQPPIVEEKVEAKKEKETN
jgi:hypothetical protein